jgi:hypothetical protein
MLWSTAYLESRLPSPLPTKDGGNLCAVKDVRAYVLGLAHSRSGGPSFYAAKGKPRVKKKEEAWQP